MHGDNFGSAGKAKDLVWLRNSLEACFEIKSTIIGSGDSLEKEVHIWNRRVDWHMDVGISYEAVS